MEFTDGEKRQWHADRKAGVSDEDEAAPSAACGHCGAPVASDNGSDFPLCGACE